MLINKIPILCYFFAFCILLTTCVNRPDIPTIATNLAPSASAGHDTTVEVTSAINLHGSGMDSDGYIVKYEWKFGNDIWKTTSTGDTTITAPSTAQAYTCSLRVTDDKGLSGVDDIVITVNYTPKISNPPTAVAGKDTTVYIGSKFSLHGTGTDKDGYIAIYEWKIGTSNWVVSTSGDTIIFVPKTAQIYRCSLRVTDNDGLFDVDDISITVSNEVIDIDGNTYKTVTIGNQTWFAENLKVTRYNDGVNISKITDGWSNFTSGAYSYYDNDSSYGNIYGYLYNGYAIETGKLAPEGWHVPADAEWDTLQSYLIANGYNWDGTVTANRIGRSMAAKTAWNGGGTNGSIGNNLTLNNLSGFSALPGGWRHFSGRYNSIGNYCAWWSTTKTDHEDLYYRCLIASYDNLIKSDNSLLCGNYVRLVKD